MTSYEEIWGVAEDWFGIITFKQIVELGIRKQLVNSMMRNGMLVKLGHGVYQVKHHVPSEFDEYAIAVAIAGPTAYLRGASVIALLGLAPTNPSVMYVGATGRVRRQLPDGYELHDACQCPVVEYERVRCQPVALALKEARDSGQLDADRVAEAALTALEKGYITDEESSEFQS